MIYFRMIYFQALSSKNYSFFLVIERRSIIEFIE